MDEPYVRIQVFAGDDSFIIDRPLKVTSQLLAAIVAFQSQGRFRPLLSRQRQEAMKVEKQIKLADEAAKEAARKAAEEAKEAARKAAQDPEEDAS